MNVRCSSCGTVYRVDPAKVPAEGVRARCARCPNVFEVVREEETRATAAPAWTGAPGGVGATDRAEGTVQPAEAEERYAESPDVPVAETEASYPGTAEETGRAETVEAPGAEVSEVEVTEQVTYTETTEVTGSEETEVVAAEETEYAQEFVEAERTDEVVYGAPSYTETAEAYGEETVPEHAQELAYEEPDAREAHGVPGEPTSEAEETHYGRPAEELPYGGGADERTGVGTVEGYAEEPEATYADTLENGAEADVEAPYAEAAPEAAAADSVEDLPTLGAATQAGAAGLEEEPAAIGSSEASTAEPAPFGTSDPHVRARRLARALVSDIVAYHGDRRDRSLRDGTLRQELGEEIRKSWDEYANQVGNQFARETSYFRDALNDILAPGAGLF